MGKEEAKINIPLTKNGIYVIPKMWLTDGNAVWEVKNIDPKEKKIVLYKINFTHEGSWSKNTKAVALDVDVISELEMIQMQG